MTNEIEIKAEDGITFKAHELIRVLMQMDTVEMFNIMADEYLLLHTEGEDYYELIAEKLSQTGQEIFKLEENFPVK